MQQKSLDNKKSYSAQNYQHLWKRKQAKKYL